VGDTAPLKEIAAVKRETGAYLLVDEAHSLGVLGETGRGLAEAAGVEADVDFIVGTFSKSLGSVGGFCVSDSPDFDIMRIVCRPYMFTASLPPGVVASTLTALQKLRTEPHLRQTLMRNAKRLYDGLQRLGFETGPEPNPIVAVSMPDQETAVIFWKMLIEAGLYLNLAVPPATPNNVRLLRTSISAAHTFAQIDTALDIFADVGRQLGFLTDGRRRAAGAL
jgi:8-amino-7-oxononanoate synthase